MRITRVQLRGLGRHHELDIRLAPGFTVVRGPNEAGKSTLQRGLELALFQKPTAATKELEALRSWGSALEERSWVRLEFQDGTADAPASGVLEKEFRGARGRVLLEYAGQTCTDPARAEQILAELTGVPGEAFYRSTASIRHEEIDDLDRDEGTLRDRLQASIGGGDRGSSRAKARLDDAIRALRSRGDRNPGRLRIAEEALARAELALGNGEAALRRLESDRDALAAARASRVRSEAALAESRGLLEAARQAERLRRDRDVIAERFERLRQAVEAQRHLEALEAAPGRPMEELREQLELLRTLESRVGVLRESIPADADPGAAADGPAPTFGLEAGTTVGLLTVALTSLLAGLLAFMPLVLLAPVALVGAVAMGLRLRRRWIAERDVRHLSEVRERDRTLRRQARAGAEEGLRSARADVAAILLDLGVADAEAAEELLAAERARLQEIATTRVQVAALLAGQASGPVDELRDRAALEFEQKSAALAALGPIATDERARERLEAEVRERTAAVEGARDAEAAAAARIDANHVDAEQVAGEAERLAWWRDQLAALKRRVRVYETTLAAIRAAESATMHKATRFLERHVGSDIARLTGGRYDRVRVDDQTLNIEAWAPERGDWVPVAQLSKGTLDQVFLAARMGLVRLVTGGRHPPLILDDPFVTFDDDRAARAASLLRDLSADFQVIYLTCSARYDALADAVVELPGPAAVGVGRPHGQGRRAPAVVTQETAPGGPVTQQ